VKGKRNDLRLRQLQAIGPKCLCHQRSGRFIRRVEDPGRVNEFGKLDFSTTSPGTSHPRAATSENAYAPFRHDYP
jgi:hypothetical protein